MSRRLLFLALTAACAAPAASPQMGRLHLAPSRWKFLHFAPGFRFPVNGIPRGGLFLHADGILSFEAPPSSAAAGLKGLLYGPPAVAFLGMPLDPATGRVEVGHPAPDRFEVRFAGVLERLPAARRGEPGQATCTVTLFRDGRIRIAYGAVSVRSALVGVSAGLGYAGLGARAADLSALSPPLNLAGAAVLYESFAGNFDLSGRVLEFAPSPYRDRRLSTADAMYLRFWDDFSFPFEGWRYRSIWIGRNGYVAFGGPAYTDPATATSFPAEHLYLAPFWTDILRGTGAVTVHMPDRDTFVVRWQGVRARTTGQALDFTLRLTRYGHFEFLYGDVSGAGPALTGYSAGHWRTAGQARSIHFAASSGRFFDDGTPALMEVFGPQHPVDLSYRLLRFEPRRTPSDLVSLGDDGFVEVVLPQAAHFPWAGAFYDRVFVNANGNVTFGTADLEWLEHPQSFLLGPPRIAPFWDDLNPSVGGAVRIRTFGAELVVSWEGVPEFRATGANTATLTLHADGSYDILYGAATMADGLVGHTAGGFAATGSERPHALAASPVHRDRHTPAWYEVFPNVTPFNLQHRFLKAAGMGSLLVTGLPWPGATLTLAIRRADRPGARYQVLASLGNRPGFTWQGAYVPLQPDALFFAVPQLPAVFQDFAGTLDLWGRARARLHLPADPGLRGLTVYLGLAILPAAAGDLPWVEPTAAAVTIP